MQPAACRFAVLALLPLVVAGPAHAASISGVRCEILMRTPSLSSAATSFGGPGMVSRLKYDRADIEALTQALARAEGHLCPKGTCAFVTRANELYEAMGEDEPFTIDRQQETVPRATQESREQVDRELSYGRIILADVLARARAVGQELGCPERDCDDVAMTRLGNPDLDAACDRLWDLVCGGTCEPHRFGLAVAFSHLTPDTLDGEPIDGGSTDVVSLTLALRPVSGRRDVLSVTARHVAMRPGDSAPAFESEGMGDVGLQYSLPLTKRKDQWPKPCERDAAAWKTVDLDFAVTIPTSDGDELRGYGDYTAYAGARWTRESGCTGDTTSGPCRTEHRLVAAGGLFHNADVDDMQAVIASIAYSHAWKRFATSVALSGRYEPADEVTFDDGSSRPGANRQDLDVGFEFGPLGKLKGGSKRSTECFIDLLARIALDDDAVRDYLTPTVAFQCQWGD